MGWNVKIYTEMRIDLEFYESKIEVRRRYVQVTHRVSVRSKVSRF